MSEAEERYRCTQLITYLGNKRKLLPMIEDEVRRVRKRLGGRRLRVLDAFAGSGVVARMLKAHASLLYSNDMELYCSVIARCYLSNRSQVDTLNLPELHRELTAAVASCMEPGLIAELYAPQDDACILPGERVFYTRRNALYLDTMRRAIGRLPDEVQPFFLAPLLYEASVHTNTAGVFKGFYKDGNGCGQFGGRTRAALSRIMADICLPLPMFSTHECEYRVLQEDAAAAARALPELDLVYLDPPYNEHPYGSNYFMLNVLAEYKRPRHISPVSGIPSDWVRSPYNQATRVVAAMADLLASLPSEFALLSYNSEGLLTPQQIVDLAQPYWHVRTVVQEYPTYRASRNLHARPPLVQEYLFILERRS